MKSILICEGGTDLTLIQYYLERTEDWKYRKADNRDESFFIKKVLQKDENILEIGAAGSCSKIPACLEKILKYNLFASVSERYQNLIIISDRDEAGTFENFKEIFVSKLTENNYTCNGDIENDSWIVCKSNDARGKQMTLRILLLIIPFEDTGALETFLLDAVSKENEYDKKIIQNIKTFVDNIDPERKYLNRRRYVTKANFDVYFSIRTPLSQFTERKNILKNVPWEQYESIQSCFGKLREL